MSAIVLNTSGSWLVVERSHSRGRDGDRVPLDRDIGVRPALLGRAREPIACLARRHRYRFAHLRELDFGQGVYDELPGSQARADLEIRCAHDDFFLDERLLDEVDRRELLDVDRRLVVLLALERAEPTFDPRLVCRVRRLPELPDPDPAPDS
jgi:hypothetical protein